MFLLLNHFKIAATKIYFQSNNKKKHRLFCTSTKLDNSKERVYQKKGKLQKEKRILSR